MARWTSMTKQQFFAAFREGQRKGRVSWEEVLTKFSTMAMASLAYQTIHSASSHELTGHKATGLVGAASIFLLSFSAVLSFSLRRQQPRPSGTFAWAIACCVAAAIVFIICLPLIG